MFAHSQNRSAPSLCYELDFGSGTRCHMGRMVAFLAPLDGFITEDDCDRLNDGDLRCPGALRLSDEFLNLCVHSPVILLRVPRT
jgi:hypothetical protein